MVGDLVFSSFNNLTDRLCLSVFVLFFDNIAIDKTVVMIYNNKANPYGTVKVSTGIMRYNKRSGLANPV